VVLRWHYLGEFHQVSYPVNLDCDANLEEIGLAVFHGLADEIICFAQAVCADILSALFLELKTNSF